MDAFQKALEAINTGKFDKAEKGFRALLKKQPGHVPALNLLTVALMQLKRFEEAEKYIARAVSINDRSDVSFYNYGLILKELGKPHQALKRFNQAIELKKTVPKTWNNRGTIFNDLNEFEKAIGDFDQALALQGNYADTFANKGKALTELKRYEEALAAYENASSLNPDLAEAWLGRGNVFVRIKRSNDALTAYEKALLLKPDLAQAWLGIGNVMIEFRRYDEALAAFDRALSLKGSLAEAWLGRAICFADLSRYQDSFVAYDKAYSLKPDMMYVEGARLHAKMHCCNWANFEKECESISLSVRKDMPRISPFSFIAIPSSAEDQLRCATTWTRTLYRTSEAETRQPYDHDKIRIGYLSSDFRNHPVSYLMAGVFENHDRERFEIYGFSTGPDDQSELRARAVKAFDHFIDLENQSDGEVATAINSNQIDILIDLIGHTKGSRAAAIAKRPAPIQVNYLGYAGTTGAEFIDYIIADCTAIPPESRKFYSEKVAYLPGSFMPHDEKGRSISKLAYGRAECELPEKAVVFCCFNNSYKINPDVFDSWLTILKSVDQSVLWLSSLSTLVRENLSSYAKSRGVAPERLIFADRVPSASDHLARHQLADLFLDTSPYNAHTTASDALWAGLPLVTLIGETFAGRVAASLLRSIGLPELITRSRSDYEALAIELALDKAKLASIKEHLRSNRLTSPLFQTKVFTHHLEAAYDQMYQRHCSGGAPEHIEVPLRSVG